MTITNRVKQFPMASFLAIAFCWTWLFWGLVIANEHRYFFIAVPISWLATFGQFGPFVAGLLVTSLAGGSRPLRAFIFRIVQWRAHPVWVVASFLLLPVTMLLAIYLFASIHADLSALSFRGAWSTLPAHFAYLLVLGGPLGEEPGWSGFALPRLQARYGLTLASIQLGLVRGVWHLPLWWMYPPPCAYTLFLAGAVLLQFLFAWLLNHTAGSVLYGVIFHTSLSVASVRLPETPAYSIWLLCLLAVVFAILLFDRRFRLTTYECQAA